MFLKHVLSLDSRYISAGSAGGFASVWSGSSCFDHFSDSTEDASSVSPVWVQLVAYKLQRHSYPQRAQSKMNITLVNDLFDNFTITILEYAVFYLI